MPYVVTQSCCADASCVVACPVNCIHPTPDEPGFATAEMLYVDASSCVDCGACLTACPVEAIKPHTKLRADEQAFVAVNADYYDVFPAQARPRRAPVSPVSKQRRLRRAGPFRVAVVGAGPAGLYAADELLKHPEVSVDVYDRLPTPYGLVRAGVAPDHQRTKRIDKLFAQIEAQPGFRYFLGVDVGRDLRLADLRAAYDGVVYAVGAAADRRLGVPGEDLPGSLSATQLVAWYNAHPEAQDLQVGLEGIGGDRAVVVGNGNVALDVARILTAEPASLQHTDLAEPARVALGRSTLREVVVLGRRGPRQAAFTVPELVGLAALAESGAVDVVVQAPDLDAALAGDDERSRLLRELAAHPPRAANRRIVLRFSSTPVRILGSEDTGVSGVEVEATRLVAGPDGRVVALPTGEREIIETGLVLRAVGYHGRPVLDLPYDEVTGTVPHHRGRVEPGIYVAGWVKRGPTGFIGTNKSDAEETVAVLLDDLDGAEQVLLARPTLGASDIAALVAERVPRRVDLAGWRAIDAEERRRGLLRDRPRSKIVATEEMLRVAHSRAPADAAPIGARRITGPDYASPRWWSIRRP